MQSVQVSGRFTDEVGTPAEGRISFIPSKLWVDDEDGQTYPTMAAYDYSLVNGAFLVNLSRTDGEELPWHYKVVCPVGTWTIRIEDDGPLLLKDLLPRRFA